MYLTSEKKEELFSQYGKSNKDTGSVESQVALFSYRIAHLTEHLKKNHKDFATQRSLIKLVGKRRALLDYMKKRDIDRYRAIVKALNLRNYLHKNDPGRPGRFTFNPPLLLLLSKKNSVKMFSILTVLLFL